MSVDTARMLDAAQLTRSVVLPPVANPLFASAGAIRRAVVIRYARELGPIGAGTDIAGQAPQAKNLAPLLQTNEPDDEATGEAAADAARRAGQLIRKVNALVLDGQSDSALDLVYDHVDALLLSRLFADADVLVRAAAQNELPLNVLVGFLTITLPWRDYLNDARTALARRIRDKAVAAGGEAKATALLHGLLLR